MPEGPSILLLKEAVSVFEGKKFVQVSGNTKLDLSALQNSKVTKFRTWGKHFIICTKALNLRIHFLLFGSYRINEERETKPKLRLEFTNGFINFYACSIKMIEQPIDVAYDWSADVLSDKWDAKAARNKLKEHDEMLVCDALLQQEIFSGVGNIIKNEVLYRIRVHPENSIEKLPARKLTELIKEARNYSFEFLHWKRNFELKKHWLAHTKKVCVRCQILLKKKHCGKTKRRTFYCENCQVLFK